ncbi:MAG: RNA methyltransferase [Planctomyces sp.]|nr:RNA methyltransferase [Planctomyces sp.]
MSRSRRGFSATKSVVSALPRSIRPGRPGEPSVNILHLKNPHSVIAALEQRPRDVIEIHIPARSPSDAWREAAALAARRQIPVRSILTTAKPGRRDEKSSREGGSEGLVRERAETPLEELFTGARARPGLWLALDSLQDPHNVGAIFRSAAFFGVRGIVLTRERSAPMSATAYDVASGGVEHVPFHQSTNLNKALQTAKDAGLWTLGTAEEAAQDIREFSLDRSWLVVLGGEENGLRRLVRENCDELCRIDGPGAIRSLNVSVAAGVALGLLSSGRGPAG